ncbi:MAG: L-idonate 5-dehydrogenase [Actinomycetota bacterium]
MSGGHHLHTDASADARANAVVIHGVGDVRYEERSVGPPAPGEVQVDVALGGICGSDISYYKHGAVGRFTVTHPMILGHEVVGVVREPGRGVTGFDDGQRIAVDPSSPCLVCDRCREGRWNICLQPSFLGSASTRPHTDGGFTSVLGTRSQNAVPLDDALADRLAVFAEPLSVCVHAVGRAGTVEGARILVVGAGPIGGMLIAACRAFGAAEVVAADIESKRLETARALGADNTRLVGEQDLGTGYDLVFDASGAGQAIADAVTRVRRGGRLVLVGLPHGGPVPLPIDLNVTGEVDIVGSFRFNHSEFRTSVDLLSGGLDLRPLISNRYAAVDANAAFVEAASGEAMKVQLDFTADSAIRQLNEEQPNDD